MIKMFCLTDMGLLHAPEKKVTVADIMSQQLENHQKQINKVSYK